MSVRNVDFLFPLPPLYTKDFEGRYNYAEPRQIGSFSVDEQRQFVTGNKHLKYVRPHLDLNNPKMDLNIGYDQPIKTDFEQEGLEYLLKWISHNQECLTTDVKFVTNRYVLRTIMDTPYKSTKSGWTICASKFRGVIYLHSIVSELERKSMLSSENSLKGPYWNAKFEHYMTSDHPGNSKTCDEPVNINAEFHSVVRSKLNDNIVIFASRMNALDHDCPPDYPEKTMRMDKYVTLRTVPPMGQSPKQIQGFVLFKLKQLWIQSALSGCSKNFIAFRDSEGIVQNIVTYGTDEIPRLHQEQYFSTNALCMLWSPNVCMNVLDKFLAFLQENVLEDNPETVYKIFWQHRQIVICEKDHSGELKILPDWYIDCFFKGG